MKSFTHFNAASVDEAVAHLKRFDGRAIAIAGGTDLLGIVKDRILPEYPEAVVNLKSIDGLDAVVEEKDGLRIGALAKLADIANHPVVTAEYAALAEAAHRTASPNLREMGTIGGNICQDIRCWYYRSRDNRFPCLRKGGGRCYAIRGDNRYHSIFGGSVEGGCYAVHPSDTAPALVALNASIETSKRTVDAETFFNVGVHETTILDFDEIVTGILLPKPSGGVKSAFLKFAIRKSIDFPIVNCATAITLDNGKVEGARICLNAVSVNPRRAVEAEEAITGEPVTEESTEAAGTAAVSPAKPMQHNEYMVQIAKTLVKRTILACG
ncbi:MAG: molybdopterin dehydrogenase [Proteobacteria bacterium]|nr:molybdopterin dehydrogenase [Pseudomonadota bacterium]